MAKKDEENRELILFCARVGDNSVIHEARMGFAGASRHDRATKLIEQVRKIADAKIQGSNDKIFPEGIGEPGEYEFFDIEGGKLPHNILVEEIPKPGLLFAVRKEANSSIPTEVVPFMYSSRYEEDDSFKEYREGNGPKFEPKEMAMFDVFISYSTEDSKLADEIRSLFDDQELRCFFAEKDIHSGKRWREEIRKSMSSSRVVVLLLTPNSVNSKWVMCEAGAFWALQKPIVPAYMFINLGDIPELITEYQCRKIETTQQKNDFVNEVCRLCRE